MSCAQGWFDSVFIFEICYTNVTSCSVMCKRAFHLDFAFGILCNIVFCNVCKRTPFSFSLFPKIWPDCFSRLPDCQIAFCVARLQNAIWQIWLCQIGPQSDICLCQIAKCNLAISGRLPQNASAIQFESQCYSVPQIGCISRMKEADAHLPD